MLIMEGLRRNKLDNYVQVGRKKKKGKEREEWNSSIAKLNSRDLDRSWPFANFNMQSVTDSVQSVNVLDFRTSAVSHIFPCLPSLSLFSIF